MTIRFAATRTSGNPVIARNLRATVPLYAANDNLEGIGSDALLRTTLLHFARHGLGSAEHARKLAEAAFFAGDRAEYRKWLAVCRSLDRRMAQALERSGYHRNR